MCRLLSSLYQGGRVMIFWLKSRFYSLIGKFVQAGREIVFPSDNVPRIAVLLKKNAYGGGLTEEEYTEAVSLIEEMPDDEGNFCWACATFVRNDSKPVVQGLAICRAHAHYALVTRK